MKCPKCQSENREGARFCNECGHEFGLTCPKCGTSNRAGSKFCDECGHDLKEPKETIPLDYSAKGEPLSGIKYTEGPFQEAEKLRDIELMAPIACELCTSYQYAGEHSRTIDVAPKVLALLEKTQRERDFFGIRYNVYSGLCGHCVFACGMLGNFEQGKAFFEKGLHFAHEVHSIYALCVLETLYGQLFNFMGDGTAGKPGGKGNKLQPLASGEICRLGSIQLNSISERRGK